MRVIVEMGHPAHVHLFKYTIRELIAKGHQVKIVARDKEVTLELLRGYDLEYQCLSKRGKGMVGLLFEMIIREYRLLQITLDYRPDLFLAAFSMCSAHIARLFGKKSITMDDTEINTLGRRLYLPFTNTVCTPDCFWLDLGKKQVRHKSYHELAYLHPDRFKPDPSILKTIGLDQGERYFIIRFVSWQASHDVGIKGLSLEGKHNLVQQLKPFGKVLISSEAPLESEFEPMRLSIHPSSIHDLLAYSSLYVGEGATMASEAAALGIPCIYINPINAGTINEQMEKYGLVKHITNEEEAINSAVGLAMSKDALELHQSKREQMLKEKIDLSAWLVDFIENYPL